MKIARQRMPDVILIDIGLPLFDGCIVAKALRVDAARVATTLATMSSYAQPADRGRSFEAGRAHTT